jgi:hypothetical protein
MDKEYNEFKYWISGDVRRVPPLMKQGQFVKAVFDTEENMLIRKSASRKQRCKENIMKSSFDHARDNNYDRKLLSTDLTGNRRWVTAFVCEWNDRYNQKD